MTDAKAPKSSTPDTLTKAGKNAGIELSENELSSVTGGNKAKTADKAYTAMDAYIKG